MRTVRQFDEDDAHVARHGQQHLAKRFRLIFFARIELQLVELGQSIDQFGDRCPKALYQVGFGNAAVFHGIVQQCGHQSLGVELPAGTLGCHGDRVRDVGFATVAHLAQMGRVSVAIGLAYQLDAGGVQVIELFHERRKTGGSRIGCRNGRGSGRGNVAGGGRLVRDIFQRIHPRNIACLCTVKARHKKSTVERCS